MELRTERANRQQKQRQSSVFTGINTIFFIIELIVLGYLGFLLWQNGVFSGTKRTYVILGIVVVVLCLQCVLLFSRKLKKTLFMLTLLLIGAFGFGSYRMQQVVALFSQFNASQNVSEITMSVVVLKNSGMTTIDELKDKTVARPTTVDGDNITALIDDIKDKKNMSLTFENKDTYYQAYEALKNGEVDAMVLSSTYEGLLSQEDNTFDSNIVKVYEFKIQKQVTRRNTVTTDQKTDVFNVYISGIDTYGPITEVSRSDVNIIATVNTTTKQILLTSTPRDSYVKIADGGNNQYDKLTHAGIYGVDASLHTLENLYGIKMDYFVRVNFTTFMNLIDVVGGVEVDNEYQFDSYTKPGKVFPAGKLHLNAEDALAYVRERYNLIDGDVGRAANQEEVITQVLKKLLSTRLLTDSDAIINQLAESVQTDMTLNTALVVINKLTGGDDGFSINSQALEVTGILGLPSYAMPSAQLWMGKVDTDSLAKVKENITNVANGKTLDLSKESQTTVKD